MNLWLWCILEVFESFWTTFWIFEHSFEFFQFNFDSSHLNSKYSNSIRNLNYSNLTSNVFNLNFEFCELIFNIFEPHFESSNLVLIFPGHFRNFLSRFEFFGVHFRIFPSQFRNFRSLFWTFDLTFEFFWFFSNKISNFINQIFELNFEFFKLKFATQKK